MRLQWCIYFLFSCIVSYIVPILWYSFTTSNSNQNNHNHKQKNSRGKNQKQNTRIIARASNSPSSQSSIRPSAHRQLVHFDFSSPSAFFPLPSSFIHHSFLFLSPSTPTLRVVYFSPVSLLLVGISSSPNGLSPSVALLLPRPPSSHGIPDFNSSHSNFLSLCLSRYDHIYVFSLEKSSLSIMNPHQQNKVDISVCRLLATRYGEPN